MKYLDSLCPELQNSLKTLNNWRPVQEKAFEKGLLERKNILVCSPTASGKTLVAEIALVENAIRMKKIGIYLAPLKALANEKYKEFKKKYPFLKIGISTGDFDSDDNKLGYYDILFLTAEKADSLIRHKSSWINDIGIVVIDEFHLLNDIKRGPVLEIVITLLKQFLKDVQFIALSATVGNPKEIANWLDANLVYDEWRPVKLKLGILNKRLNFMKE